jgi:hypothetical protein
MKRGSANIEDQFRSALALLEGLGVIDKRAEKILKDGIGAQMSGFLMSLLKTESGIVAGRDLASRNAAQGVLQSFLLSFASRAASRERLHVLPCSPASPRMNSRFVSANAAADGVPAFTLVKKRATKSALVPSTIQEEQCGNRGEI